MTIKRSILKLAFGFAALTWSAFMGTQTALAENAPIAPLASPDVYKIIAENDQFRVIEATWQPGHEDNFHSHPGDRVSLFRMDCKIRLTKPDGTYRDGEPKAGRAVVRTGKPVKSHKAKNIGDNVCVVHIVELK